MIDLHNHILPGLDDGSTSLEMSLEMARIAVADGITHIACTPHVMPGVYDNSVTAITRAIHCLAKALNEQRVNLSLSIGADIHTSPDLGEQISRREIPMLNNSRYFLLEPPHDIRLPGLARLVERFVSRGYVPIVTHPERFAWIEHHYDSVCELHDCGALLQLTAGSITGGFGNRAQYWSERMLDENRVAIIATDAHHPKRRPPILSRARDVVAERWGDALALRLTVEVPFAILADKSLPPITAGARPRHASVRANPGNPLKFALRAK